MKKTTKYLITLSAISLLAMGTAMTSSAASGWVEEDDGWVYYDSEGYKVTDTWKKSGDNWFYLDEDGNMSIDTLIEDEDNLYYVDENGAMVVNRWVQRANEDESGENSAADNWYYFQSTGKAYKAGDKTTLRTIDGKKYAFDEDGKMLYGWVDENSQRLDGDYDWKNATYFFGGDNDGVMATGWAQIYVLNDEDVDDETQQAEYPWFYFKSNGKKVSGESKTINGLKYSFNSNGVMETSWVKGSDSVGTGSAAGYQYYSYADSEEGGNRVKGWFKAIPSEDIDKEAHDAGDEQWFYSLNSGEIVQSQFKTINGKKYGFGETGKMLNGLQAIHLDSDDPAKIIDHYKIENENGIKAAGEGTEFDGFDFSNSVVYYFGDYDDGAAKTGTQNIFVDGESYNYYFIKNGSAKSMAFGNMYSSKTCTPVYAEDGSIEDITFIYDKKCIYQNGRRIKADKEERYAAFDQFGSRIDDKSSYADGRYYLINSNGVIMTNKKNVNDSDDMYFCTNSKGIITYYSGDKCTNHNNDTHHE